MSKVSATHYGDNQAEVMAVRHFLKFLLENMTMANEFSGWCRQLLNSLNDGGTWGIPRSGIIFQRQGDTLVWVTSMPYDKLMAEVGVNSEEELREQQQSEFELTREQFAEAGISVTRQGEEN